ncbi:hypothetical protein LCGC14_3004820 [marine sediment metagenome]|uniref:Zinc ribbon domain-containing protein n=1 Tax=marine sediment metagenome TaxID=412755 RepID=A0A0F8Z7M3_9ZZZZ
MKKYYCLSCLEEGNIQETTDNERWAGVWVGQCWTHPNDAEWGTTLVDCITDLDAYIVRMEKRRDKLTVQVRKLRRNRKKVKC